MLDHTFIAAMAERTMADRQSLGTAADAFSLASVASADARSALCMNALTRAEALLHRAVLDLRRAALLAEQLREPAL